MSLPAIPSSSSDEEHDEISITCSVMSAVPEHVTRVMEVFSRAACGLALDGISLMISIGPYVEFDEESEGDTETGDTETGEKGGGTDA